MSNLVIRTGGGLGDIICCLPAIAGLIERDGPENVAVGFEGQYMPLLDGYGPIERLDISPAKMTTGRLRVLTTPRLRKRYGNPFSRFQTLFDLRGPERAHEMKTHERPYLSRIEVFAEACGVIPRTYTPRLHLTEAELHRSGDTFPNVSPSPAARPVIALAWRSASPYKDWPHMAALADSLGQAGCLVVALDATTPFPAADLNVTGHTYRQVAALLAACDVLVVLDSGLLHLAAAVDCPTVALFGPTDGAVTCKHYPYVRVIQHNGRARTKGCNPPCRNSPLNGHRCSPDSSHCMASITVDEVQQAVFDVLGEERSRSGVDWGRQPLTGMEAVEGLASPITDAIASSKPRIGAPQ